MGEPVLQRDLSVRYVHVDPHPCESVGSVEAVVKHPITQTATDAVAVVIT